MKNLTFLLLLSSTLCFSQVGIGTTSPNATLDIRSSNEATPANTDGLLIPKVDEFPVVNPTALQDGMLVYATGIGSVTQGFYYWEFGTTSWVAIGGAGSTIDKIDDLIDGKSDNDGSNNGSSIFLGIDAGLNDDGTDNQNVGVGYQSLFSNTSGWANAASGYQSLYSNTIGLDNTANGYQSLYFNATGWANTASGYQALYSNTTGLGNTANGYQSLYFNATGWANTANGIGALYSNTTGDDNTASGTSSLSNNTTGNYNTANGSGSLISNTTGLNNTAIGYRSLHYNTIGGGNTTSGGYSLFNNTIGNSNTASGSYSLYSNTTGIRNTASGNNSLYNNITGDANIAMGNNAGNNALGDANIFLGNNAGYYEAGSYKLYIENSNADADNALIYGEFDTNILRTNGTFQIGNPTGTGYALPAIDGTANQVLQTDGAGGTSWVDPSASVTHAINDLVDGKSDNDGTDDGSSIFLGIDAGMNDDGTDNHNVGMGYQSLSSNTDGWQNTGIGYQALASNTSGTQNSATGDRALLTNTTGSQNVANGDGALYNNTIGSENTALGSYALVSNVSGNQNTAVGRDAMLTNDLGHANTAVGFGTAFFNLDGYANTAIGLNALHDNLAGNRNIAVGANALNDLNGDNNVAVGASSGINTDGSNNVFVGYRAGAHPTGSIKDRSVMIGNEAGSAEANSDRLYIENSNSTTPLIYGEFDNDILGFNGDVAIGHQAPVTPLHVENDGTSGVQNIVATLSSNISNRPILLFSESSFTDLSAGMSLEYNGTGSGAANRMIINNVGGSPLFEFSHGGDMTLQNGDIVVRGTATDREIKLDDDAGNPDRALMRQTGTQDIYVGDIDDNGGDLYLRAGGSTDMAVMAGTGFIGVNTTNPSASLHVNHPNGAASHGFVLSNATDADEWRMYHQWSSNTLALMFNNVNVGNFDDVSGTYSAVSDRNLKKNISPKSSVLEQIQQLEVVDYNFKNQLDNKKYTGLIAQDVEKLFPELVVPPSEETKNYTMDYSGFGVLAIKAIQEQQERIEILEKELQEIKSLLKNRQ